MMAECAAPIRSRGNLADAAASKDLDHYAWTLVTCLTKLPGAEAAFSLYFSKDADMWECAVPERSWSSWHWTSLPRRNPVKYGLGLPRNNANVL